MLQVSAPEGAKEPGASHCNRDGGGCQALSAGGTFTADAVFKTSRGSRASLRLDASTVVDATDEVELGLLDGDEHRLEVRRGKVVLFRSGDATAAAKGAAARALVLRLVDATVELDPSVPTTLAVLAPASDRAALTVHRGKITVRPAAGTPVELRSGQSLRLVTGRAPDLRAGYTGEPAPIDAYRADLSTDGKPAPNKPRGFGAMTARVPGQEAVVSGVRLVSHKVRVVVRDGFARTEVEEVFHNDTNRVLEGRYVFPLPPDASISRVALWVGDELVEGEIVERKRAARIFKGIVDDTVRPRDPALLEWVSGGHFSLKIFPIPAKTSRRVLLSYDQALSQQGSTTRYVYPMSLGAERATTIDELSFELVASDSRSKLRHVRTPRYPADVETGQDVKVRFAAREFAPVADFVVSFESEPRSDAQLSAYVPEWGKASGHGLDDVEVVEGDMGFFALRVRADLPKDAPLPAFVRRDRAVVVDTSYSQSKETLAGELAL